MKVSAKTEYACIAMLELAAQYRAGEPVRIRSIAERHGVPARFLVQILLQLKGAGFVGSVRGAAGGYQLLRRPEDISLGQIMEVIDGPPEESSLGSSATSLSPVAKVLAQTWRDVCLTERRMLAAVSLADLLERATAQHEQTYQI